MIALDELFMYSNATSRNIRFVGLMTELWNPRRTRSLLVVTALVAPVLLGVRVFAQTEPCLRGTVSVSILMPQGATAHALTPDDFRVKLKNETVKILSVVPANPPHRIIVLLDSSGSVLSAPVTWHAYLAMTRNLLTSLPQGTTATLAVFADRIDMVIPVTNDRAQLESKLESLEPGWGIFQRPRSTALWDALKAASGNFSPGEEGDTVYVLTDGDDNASLIQAGELDKALRFSGVRLYSISIRPSGFESTFAKEPRMLQDVAVDTGGSAALVSGKNIAQFVPRFYLLEVELPTRSKNSKNNDKLLITLSGASSVGIVADYVSGLPACTSNTIEGATH